MQWNIDMFQWGNDYPLHWYALLCIPKVNILNIHPFFNERKVHRYRTSLSSLGHPWAYGEKANEGEEVHVQGQPDLWPCTSCVTGSTFSVLLRQRPCFDVIRLNNWGDVVDLARNHRNHRWDFNTIGPIRFRALKSAEYPDLSHRIIATMIKELVPTWAQRQKRIPGSRSYTRLLARYDLGF